MLRILKLIIILLSFSVSFSIYGQENKKKKRILQQPKYELTMCCMTHDEAEYLPEWIEFHIKQGIEHIHIYDNLTKVDLHYALREYVQKKLIDITPWPYDHYDYPSWVKVQHTAYEDCLNRYGEETEWCAFIDTDEFLFCPDGKNLREFLKSYKDYQALMVCWLIYGTNNIWRAPEGKLIQTLLYRVNDHSHLAMKPIVKPRDVINIQSVHYFKMRNQLRIIDENYRPLSRIEGGYFPKKQSVNKIRLNHYMFRDGKFFEEVKIPRYLKKGWSREAAVDLEAVMNVFYDDCILKCIP
jgi:hypothetical protein